MKYFLEGVVAGDPIAALRQLTANERELETLRYDMVKKARGAGRSWEDIASALGVSRQSAWQYYAPRILIEFDKVENSPNELSSEQATDTAVAETTAVRRRRRSTSG